MFRSEKSGASIRKLAFSDMISSNTGVWTFLILFMIGLIGLYIYIGVYVGNKDTNNDVRKHLIIIGSLTGVITFFFGIISFFYFAANQRYVTEFLLLMNFVTLFLSLFALSTSSLQILS